MLDADAIHTFFEQLIEQQKAKVLKVARQSLPQVTPEDIRNPQDFPELLNNPNFNFEDGILSGYIAAKIALLTELKSGHSDQDESLPK